LIDLADDVSIKNALRAIHNSTNKVDILVNNAGIASGGLFQMTSIAELRRLFEVNFFGQILFTQGISRIMARNKSGSIINITSSAASIPEIGTLAYGSSKAAFSRATESMAKELGDNGIRVNAIAPGLIETDMYEQMSPEGRDRLISRAAIKRAGKPEDVANIALFLASDLSQFMTGQVLSVDGGLT
jgi:3-oxoacyl-[acyl-carrier protein] reductase